MKNSSTRGFWSDCGLPIVVNMGVFCVLNYLWNIPFWPGGDPEGLYDITPQSIPVYMIGASLLGLALLWPVYRRGAVTLTGLGLAADAWKPWKRALGVVLILLVAYFFLKNLPNVVEEPTWGDYLFWFGFLLPASLGEFVVFVLLGYCLVEAWLRRQGWNALSAGIVAALFSGVTFGLYHYTHEERWHAYAINLIPVMWASLLYFTLTRNFHLTLLLHNAFASVGFTGEQYAEVAAERDPWMDPSYYNANQLAMIYAAFIVPYVVLLVMESNWQKQAARKQL